MASKGAELIRRIDLHAGLHITRWGPDLARVINQLYNRGLIIWATGSNYRGRSKATLGFEVQHSQRHQGMRIVLTPKGRIMRSKL
jgi:hypothetical protein